MLSAPSPGPQDARLLRHHHRFTRRFPAAKPTPSDHPLTIHDHRRGEPPPVQAPVNRHAIEPEIVTFAVFIGAEPAFLDPCILAKNPPLPRPESLRQPLAGTASELDLESCNQRRHHAIRRCADLLNHARTTRDEPLPAIDAAKRLSRPREKIGPDALAGAGADPFPVSRRDSR
jgi:hypothetical protein